MLFNTILVYISHFNNPVNIMENVDLVVYSYRLYIALPRLKGINIYTINPKLYYILILILLIL